MRGRFIDTVAVRVGAGIGNDKDRTMPSARSSGPGVVRHGIGGREGVAAVEKVETEERLDK